MSSPGLSPKPPPISCHLTIKLSFCTWRRGAAHIWGLASALLRALCGKALAQPTAFMPSWGETASCTGTWNCLHLPVWTSPRHLNDAFCLDWQRVGGTQLFYVLTVTECFTDYFPAMPLEWPCHLQAGSHLVTASLPTSDSFSASSPGVLVLTPWTEISNLLTSCSPNSLTF